MARVVDVSDFPRIFKDYTKKLKDRYRVAAERGIIRSKPMLIERTPVDTGEMAKSWDYVKEEKKFLLGNFAPHAPQVEFGARPFRPPLEPLLAWAKRVLKDPSQPPEYSAKVRGLARGVQRKIEEEGMKPRHILTDAIEEIKENMRKELKEINLEKTR